jgi:hypothetical protein
VTSSGFLLVKGAKFEVFICGNKSNERLVKFSKCRRISVPGLIVANKTEKTAKRGAAIASSFEMVLQMCIWNNRSGSIKSRIPEMLVS